jgi:hypothetical protein
LPPASFDVIYAVSVVTHLDQAAQRLWFAEWRRLLRPRGRLLLTFHGESVWRDLSVSDIAEIEQKGLLFRKSTKLRGICPDWYHTAFHSQRWLRTEMERHFTTVQFVPGAFGYQDAAIASYPKLP